MLKLVIFPNITKILVSYQVKKRQYQINSTFEILKYLILLDYDFYELILQ